MLSESSFECLVNEQESGRRDQIKRIFECFDMAQSIQDELDAALDSYPVTVTDQHSLPDTVWLPVDQLHSHGNTHLRIPCP
jgi:hypothetical protein